jgi:DNA-binding NarL/FixJ family response regulator
MMSVVVVHDEPRRCTRLHEALRNQHVVHVARNVDEMLEELGTATRLACIVCVASQKTNAREVRDHAVMQGAPAERIVFISTDDLGRPEMLERTARVVESFRPANSVSLR